MTQSFATRRDERNYRNEYMKYLKLQIQIADKIGSRNFEYDSGINFREPQKYMSLEEQLSNSTFQRDLVYENASKLFDDDSKRINAFMDQIGEERYIYFNKIFPEILNFRTKYKFLLVDQVIRFMEDYERKEILTNAVDQPVQTRTFNNRMDYIENSINNLQAQPQQAPPQPATGTTGTAPRSTLGTIASATGSTLGAINTGVNTLANVTNSVANVANTGVNAVNAVSNLVNTGLNVANTGYNAISGTANAIGSLYNTIGHNANPFYERENEDAIEENPLVNEAQVNEEQQVDNAEPGNNDNEVENDDENDYYEARQLSGIPESAMLPRININPVNDIDPIEDDFNDFQPNDDEIEDENIIDVINNTPNAIYEDQLITFVQNVTQQQLGEIYSNMRPESSDEALNQLLNNGVNEVIYRIANQYNTEFEDVDSNFGENIYNEMFNKMMEYKKILNNKSSGTNLINDFIDETDETKDNTIDTEEPVKSNTDDIYNSAEVANIIENVLNEAYNIITVNTNSDDIPELIDNTIERIIKEIVIYNNDETDNIDITYDQVNNNVGKSLQDFITSKINEKAYDILNNPQEEKKADETIATDKIERYGIVNYDRVLNKFRELRNEEPKKIKMSLGDMQTLHNSLVSETGYTVPQQRLQTKADYWNAIGQIYTYNNNDKKYATKNVILKILSKSSDAVKKQFDVRINNDITEDIPEAIRSQTANNAQKMGYGLKRKSNLQKLLSKINV